MTRQAGVANDEVDVPLEVIARALLRALEENDPHGCVEGLEADDYVVIDGRFHILEVVEAMNRFIAIARAPSSPSRARSAAQL